MWDAEEHERQRVLAALREHKSELGHLRVVQNYACFSDGDPAFPLGVRLHTIRSGNTFTGTADNPMPFRLELDKMNFVWDAEEHERQRVLAALRQFKEVHLRVKISYKCFSDGDVDFPGTCC